MTPTPKANGSTLGASPDLTPRQEQTLRLLLEGLAEKEVAGRMSISRHTVHVHVRMLYRRFEVTTRAQLMARFLKPPSDASPGFRPGDRAEA